VGCRQNFQQLENIAVEITRAILMTEYNFWQAMSRNPTFRGGQCFCGSVFGAPVFRFCACLNGSPRCSVDVSNIGLPTMDVSLLSCAASAHFSHEKETLVLVHPRQDRYGF